MQVILPTVAVFAFTVAACSKPQPSPSASSSDGNAASVSGKPESGAVAPSTPSAAVDAPDATAATATETKSGVKLSQAECDRAMDKYLELEMASNPALKDVPPELVAQAKAMAREAHGAPPCTATRAQYTCAMGAASTAAWQKCMK